MSNVDDAAIGTYPALAVEDERSFLTRVMGWMCLGLLVTAVIAWAIGTSDRAVNWVSDHPFVFLGLIIAQLALVGALAFRVSKMTPAVAAGVFLLYAGLNGITFSLIFAVYTTTSIVSTFLITSAMFGALGTLRVDDEARPVVDRKHRLHGPLRADRGLDREPLLGELDPVLGDDVRGRRDLLRLDRVRHAEDQAARTSRGNTGTDEDKREAILGALTLYLDFVNLFLFFLRIFGRER